MQSCVGGTCCCEWLLCRLQLPKIYFLPLGSFSQCQNAALSALEPPPVRADARCPPGAQSYSHQPPPPPCTRHLPAEAIRGRSGKLGTHSAAPWPRPVYLQVSCRCRRSDQNFRKCTASNRCSPATHSGHCCACGYACAHVCMCVSMKSRGTRGLSTHNASLPLLNNTIVEKALNLLPLASSSPRRGRREATHLPPTSSPPEE